MPETVNRKLKAEGSNPEAPAKKLGKNNEEDMEMAEAASMAVPAGSEEASSEGASDQGDEEAPKWATKMMKKIDKVVGKVDHIIRKAEEALRVSRQAQQEASSATIGLTAVESELQNLKVEMQKLPKLEVPEGALEQAIEKFMETKWPCLSGKHSGQTPADARLGNGGDIVKGRGKGAEAAERNSRTITFGRVPEGTMSTTITAFIKSTLGEGPQADIEELFAYGKKFAERGGVRFRSCKTMWKYMEENAGNHKRMHGNTAVYVNVYDGGLTQLEKDTAKAVRKMTRAIIEEIGGDGQTVKEDIGANYTTVKVKYQGKLVAEWQDGEMKVLDDGKPFAARFRTLMDKE